MFRMLINMNHKHNTAVVALVAAFTLLINLFFATGYAGAQDTNKASSEAFCLHAVLEATNQAFPEGLSKVRMDAVQQKFFADHTNAEATVEWLKTKGVLEGKAGGGAVIRDWLKSKGFDIVISDRWKVAAAVFNLSLDWKVPGSKGRTQIDGKTYTALKMQTQNLGVYSSEGHEFPVFELRATDEDFEVFLTEWVKPVGKGVNLVSIASGVTSNLKPSAIENSLVSIPAVTLNKSVDVSWLQGMSSKTFSVDQAIKEVKFELTEKGLKASSAVVFSTRGIGPSAYVVKNPFLVIVKKKGSTEPVFVTHCSPDSWQLEK